MDTNQPSPVSFSCVSFSRHTHTHSHTQTHTPGGNDCERSRREKPTGRLPSAKQAAEKRAKRGCKTHLLLPPGHVCWLLGVKRIGDAPHDEDVKLQPEPLLPLLFLQPLLLFFAFAPQRRAGADGPGRRAATAALAPGVPASSREGSRGAVRGAAPAGHPQQVPPLFLEHLLGLFLAGGRVEHGARAERTFRRTQQKSTAAKLTRLKANQRLPFRTRRASTPDYFLRASQQCRRKRRAEFAKGVELGDSSGRVLSAAGPARRYFPGRPGGKLSSAQPRASARLRWETCGAHNKQHVERNANSASPLAVGAPATLRPARGRPSAGRSRRVCVLRLLTAFPLGRVVQGAKKVGRNGTTSSANEKILGVGR